MMINTKKQKLKLSYSWHTLTVIVSLLELSPQLVVCLLNKDVKIYPLKIYILFEISHVLLII